MRLSSDLNLKINQMEVGTQASIWQKEEILRQTQEDIEFLQMLTHPKYITFLIANGYLDDPQFLKYLTHLEYLKDPRYPSHSPPDPCNPSTIKLIEYPICWRVLALLQTPAFVNDWKQHWEQMTVNFEAQLFSHYVDLGRPDESSVNSV